MSNSDKHVSLIEPAQPHEDTRWLTPAEVADRHRKEESSLANERYRGEGLPFLKLPSGRVLYNLDDVLAYERTGMRGFAWTKLADALAAVPGLSAEQQLAVMDHLRKRL